jgi:serine/threonine protein kinase
MPLFRKEEEGYVPTLTLEAPVYSLERGSTFADRYEIIEELGKGGMGRVYKVYDKKIREIIALKLLKPEIASDLRTTERFSNELRFARKISHPHVCRMYDLGEEGQAHFITMEYVPGEDLKSFIRRAGHLTEPKAMSIAAQIAEGLAEAHRLGVLHRDLKPQNVMIDRDGNAKVMDFGIARSLHAAGLTASGVMVGTPEYMSPEQAEASVVDQRSDIYSLGIILYEMVTGRVPFSGETPLSIALKQKVEMPRDPRELNSMISEGLSRLIMKCLEKDKEKRYQSAQELRADLDRIEKGLPTVERVVIEKKQAAAEKKVHRPKVWKIAVSAFVLAVVLGLVAIISQRSLWHAEKGIAPSHRNVAEKPGPPAPPIPTGAPTLSPSAEKQARDFFGKWMERLTGESSKESPGTSGIIGPILKEAMKNMKPEELDQVEKGMERIRQYLPSDSRYQTIWNDAYAKIRESRQHREAGQVQESQKSYEEGQSQMRKLLDLVDQKEKADAAKTEMDLAQKKAELGLPAGKQSLLFKIASAKERDAADAYAKEDFSGAKTLYNILTKVFELSPTVADEEGAVSLLRSYLAEIKTGAISANARRLAAWHFQEAAKEEANGEALRTKRDYAAAAEAYLRAAFLYEKAREKAVESVPQK